MIQTKITVGKYRFKSSPDFSIVCASRNNRMIGRCRYRKETVGDSEDVLVEIRKWHIENLIKIAVAT